MGSTKIIHVLKNDNFDEVFDLFRNAEAEEVIFIFPKGSRFAKQGQYFEAIKREADGKACKISIMTADSVIAGYAARYGIELLQTPEPQKREHALELSDPKPNLSEFNSDRLSTDDSNGDVLRAQLAVSKNHSQGRIIKDIIRPEMEIERPINVREEKTRPFEVEIKKELQAKNDTTGDITKVWANREQERTPLATKKSRTPKTFKGTMILLAGGSILVLALILYGTLGSARVTIKPQKQELNFQLKISASSAATDVDSGLNRIPGQYFAYKDEVSGESSTTGQKDVVQKASGNITIYNKSTSEQRLVATTRFRSLDGLIFRIPRTITVPAAIKTGETLKEGSVASIVYADKAGAEYNIGLTDFTIPGFEGSPKYEQFYAKSMASMSGGIIGPSQVVTEEDFAKIQEDLNNKLKEKILRSLKDQAGELKILDSIAIKIDAPATNAKVGEAASSLKMTVGGYANTLAFHETDVMELIRNYVSKKGDLELLEKDLIVDYINPQTSTNGQTMTFDVRIIGQAAVKIDQEKILKDIQGMKEDAIRNYFKNMKEVESARVTLSPFWVKSIPKDPAKIKLNVERE